MPKPATKVSEANTIAIAKSGPAGTGSTYASAAAAPPRSEVVDRLHKQITKKDDDGENSTECLDKYTSKITVIEGDKSFSETMPICAYGLSCSSRKGKTPSPDHCQHVHTIDELKDKLGITRPKVSEQDVKKMSEAVFEATKIRMELILGNLAALMEASNLLAKGGQTELAVHTISESLKTAQQISSTALRGAKTTTELLSNSVEALGIPTHHVPIRRPRQ